ncbi:MAG: RNA polymerase sigma factor [Ignavibacteriaceae bacterium]
MSALKEEFIRSIDEYKGIVNKISIAYTNNTDDRNDLKQEILIQLWKSFPKFNRKSKLSTWIYRVALNTAISNLRKTKKKILEVELSDKHYQIPEPDNKPETDDNIKILYELIYRLNDLERAIIFLYLEDLSYFEIAGIVGISETNVATKLSRIKLKLKNQFKSNQ